MAATRSFGGPSDRAAPSSPAKPPTAPRDVTNGPDAPESVEQTEEATVKASTPPPSAEAGVEADATAHMAYRVLTDELAQLFATECRQARARVTEIVIDAIGDMRTLAAGDAQSHWGTIAREDMRRALLGVLDSVYGLVLADAPAETAPTAARFAGGFAGDTDGKSAGTRAPAAATPPLDALVDALRRLYRDVITARDAHDAVRATQPELTTSATATWFVRDLVVAHIDETARFAAVDDDAVAKAAYAIAHEDAYVYGRMSQEAVRAAEETRADAMAREQLLRDADLLAAGRHLAYATPATLARVRALSASGDAATRLGPTNAPVGVISAPPMLRADALRRFIGEELAWNLTLRPEFGAPAAAAAMGRRTTLSQLTTAVGVGAPVQAAAALGLLPWVVHRPLPDTGVGAADADAEADAADAVALHRLRDHARTADAVAALADPLGLQVAASATAAPPGRWYVTAVQEDLGAPSRWARDGASPFDAVVRDAIGTPPGGPTVVSAPAAPVALDRFLAALADRLLALPSRDEDGSEGVANLRTYLADLDPEPSADGSGAEQRAVALLRGLLAMAAGVPLLRTLSARATDRDVVRARRKMARLIVRRVRGDGEQRLSGRETDALMAHDAAHDAATLQEALVTILYCDSLCLVLGELAGPAAPVLLGDGDSAHLAAFRRVATRASEEVDATLSAGLREYLHVVSDELGSGAHGAVEWPPGNGLSASVLAPLICEETLRLDAARLAVRLGVHRVLLTDYLWRWRYDIAGAGDGADAEDEEEEAPPTQRPGLFRRALLGLATLFGGGSAAAPQPAQQPAQRPAPRPVLFGDGVRASLLRSLGRLTVGAANYATLFGVLGLPVSLSPTTRDACVLAAALGGVPTASLRALVATAYGVDAAPLAMARFVFADDTGACLAALRMLATAEGTAYFRTLNEVAGEKEAVGPVVVEWLQSLWAVKKAYAKYIGSDFEYGAAVDLACSAPAQLHYLRRAVTPGPPLKIRVTPLDGGKSTSVYAQDREAAAAAQAGSETPTTMSDAAVEAALGAAVRRRDVVARVVDGDADGAEAEALGRAMLADDETVRQWPLVLVQDMPLMLRPVVYHNATALVYALRARFAQRGLLPLL